MFRLFTIILLLASANLKAQSILEFLEQKAGALKVVKSIDDADAQVRVLRQNLSVRPLDRDATSDEIQIITKTIVETETASLLANGAYDFQFSKTAYQLPRDTLTDRERTHYGYMFCLARTTHLLALNPLFNREDVITMLGRDVVSRHMPEWMKDIFRANLKQVDWLGWVSPHLNIKGFALTQVRLEERVLDQKTRKAFELTVTPQNLDDAEKFHQKKGLTFDWSAGLQPGEYMFDAFGISTASYQCVYYACKGPYGYFAAKDFGQQIVDNFDSDPKLQSLVRRSILGDERLSPSFPDIEIPYTTRSVAKKFLKQRKLAEFQVYAAKLEKRRADFFKIDDGKSYDEAEQALREEFSQKLDNQTLKDLVSHETSSGVVTAFAPNIITYPDLISYLNQFNIYAFNKDCEENLTLNSFGNSVTCRRGKNVFIYQGERHATQLIPHENTEENLLEYIKAKEHEKKI